MPALLSKWATPLITGLFFVSLISGIAIFFGVGRQYFQEMHEWLSMVLIVPFVLHLWRNWRPFLNYLSRPTMLISSVVTLVAAIFFAAPGLMSSGDSRRGPPPERAVVEMLHRSTIGKIAPLFGLPAEELQMKLQGKGFTINSVSDDTIDEIAVASGKPASELLSTMLAFRPN